MQETKLKSNWKATEKKYSNKNTAIKKETVLKRERNQLNWKRDIHNYLDEYSYRKEPDCKERAEPSAGNRVQRGYIRDLLIEVSSGTESREQDIGTKCNMIYENMYIERNRPFIIFSLYYKHHNRPNQDSNRKKPR